MALIRATQPSEAHFAIISSLSKLIADENALTDESQRVVLSSNEAAWFVESWIVEYAIAYMLTHVVKRVVAHNDTNQPYDGLFSSDLSALESCNIHPTFELLHMVNLAVEQVAKSKDDRIVVTPGLFTKASESLENLTKIFKPQIRSRAIVYLNALCIQEIVHEGNATDYELEKRIKRLFNPKSHTNCNVVTKIRDNILTVVRCYASGSEERVKGIDRVVSLVLDGDKEAGNGFDGRGELYTQWAKSMRNIREKTGATLLERIRVFGLDSVLAAVPQLAGLPMVQQISDHIRKSSPDSSALISSEALIEFLETLYSQSMKLTQSPGETTLSRTPNPHMGSPYPIQPHVSEHIERFFNSISPSPANRGDCTPDRAAKLQASSMTLSEFSQRNHLRLEIQQPTDGAGGRERGSSCEVNYSSGSNEANGEPPASVESILEVGDPNDSFDATTIPHKDAEDAFDDDYIDIAEVVLNGDRKLENGHIDDRSVQTLNVDKEWKRSTETAVEETGECNNERREDKFDEDMKQNGFEDDEESVTEVVIQEGFKKATHGGEKDNVVGGCLSPKVNRRERTISANIEGEGGTGSSPERVVISIPTNDQNADASLLSLVAARSFFLTDANMTRKYGSVSLQLNESGLELMGIDMAPDAFSTAPPIHSCCSCKCANMETIGPQVVDNELVKSLLTAHQVIADSLKKFIPNSLINSNPQKAKPAGACSDLEQIASSVQVERIAAKPSTSRACEEGKVSLGEVKSPGLTAEMNGELQLQDENEAESTSQRNYTSRPKITRQKSNQTTVIVSNDVTTSARTEKTGVLNGNECSYQMPSIHQNQTMPSLPSSGHSKLENGSLELKVGNQQMQVNQEELRGFDKAEGIKCDKTTVNKKEDGGNEFEVVLEDADGGSEFIDIETCSVENALLSTSKPTEVPQKPDLAIEMALEIIHGNKAKKDANRNEENKINEANENVKSLVNDSAKFRGHPTPERLQKVNGLTYTERQHLLHLQAMQAIASNKEKTKEMAAKHISERRKLVRSRKSASGKVQNQSSSSPNKVINSESLAQKIENWPKLPKSASPRKRKTPPVKKVYSRWDLNSKSAALKTGSTAGFKDASVKRSASSAETKANKNGLNAFEGSHQTPKLIFNLNDVRRDASGKGGSFIFHPLAKQFQGEKTSNAENTNLESDKTPVVINENVANNNNEEEIFATPTQSETPKRKSSATTNAFTPKRRKKAISLTPSRKKKTASNATQSANAAELNVASSNDAKKNPMEIEIILNRIYLPENEVAINYNDWIKKQREFEQSLMTDDESAVVRSVSAAGQSSASITISPSTVNNATFSFLTPTESAASVRTPSEGESSFHTCNQEKSDQSWSEISSPAVEKCAGEKTSEVGDCEKVEPERESMNGQAANDESGFFLTDKTSPPSNGKQLNGLNGVDGTSHAIAYSLGMGKGGALVHMKPMPRK